MSLPSGYKQLEYIESTGTQLINTGYYPNNNTRIVMDVEGSSAQTASNLFFGTTDGNGYYCGKVDSSWKLYGWYGNTYTTMNYGSAEAYAARKTIDFNKNVLTVNGESSTITANTFSVTCPLMLLGYNQAGTYSLHSVAKLYSCKIYDNGTLVRDFVPCKNVSGVVGLWDDVNSVFYENAGTGTFFSSDNMPPVGDHNANMNGTAYELGGSKAMIGGTVYEVSGGKVMDGGTVYEINFAGGSTITVNITGSGNSASAYVLINGTYYTNPTTLEIIPGTRIIAKVASSDLFANMQSAISLNGVAVASGGKEYTFTPDCDVVNIELDFKGGSAVNIIRITTK